MSLSSEFQSTLTFNTKVIIKIGESSSDIIDLHGVSLVAIVTPEALELLTTELKFSAATSLDGTAIELRNDSDNPIVIPIVANRYILLTPSDLLGVRFIKITVPSVLTADVEFLFVGKAQ